MRIVATSDTHSPFDADMIPDGDVFIHAGDLMYGGTPDEWNPVLESLRSLPHKLKLFIPGNHDFHVQNYQGVATAELRRAGVTVVGLNRPVVQVGKLNILGIPYVTGLPGWAFNVAEEWLHDHLLEAVRGTGVIDVVVSHAPVYGILDVINPDDEHHRYEHVGGLATNRWFHGLEQKPRVWINGHIHESYGRTTVDGCTFYNVAMCDRSYEQSNAPMIIDL